MATGLILFIGYMVLVVLLLVIAVLAGKYEARKKREQEIFDANRRGRQAFREVFGVEPTGNKPKKK